MKAAIRELRKPVRLGLVLIMFVGYVFMAFMVTEQERIIDNQRTLIRSLSQDSAAFLLEKAHLSKK